MERKEAPVTTSNVRIIGLTGLAHSGKDTIGGMLPAVRMSFAQPLKQFCAEVFDFRPDQVWGNDKEQPDSRYRRPTGELLTPRFAMQTLGTEWGRNCDPNVWARYGVRKAKQALARGARRVVFTDCRFINEAQHVIDAGGEIWRVLRPGAGLSGAAGVHPSEREQLTPEFGKLVAVDIWNGGTVDELRRQVELLIAQRCVDSDSDFAGMERP